jgi:uncharacterized protein
MSLRWLKKILPNRAEIKSKVPGGKNLLNNPKIWHFNRRSVSLGFAIGMLVAFIPLPFQMVIAAFLAILLKINLPTALAATWVSNPLTFLPFNYLIYKTGAWVLQEPNL